jgi:protein phosphatase
MFDGVGAVLRLPRCRVGVHGTNFHMPRPNVNSIAGLAAVLISAVWLLRRRRSRRVPPVSEPVDVFLQLLLSGGGKSVSRQFQPHEIITVGRRSSNLVCLADTGISGCHFQIQYNCEELCWQLVDLGSLNGTTVNRILISVPENGRSDPYCLTSGDQILVGERTVLQVLCHPSRQPVTHGVAAAKAGGQRIESIADELLAANKATPLPSEVLDSIQHFEYEEIRARGCSIQKQGSRANHTHGCEDTFSHFAPFSGVGGCAMCLCDGHCGSQTSAKVQLLLPAVIKDKLQACSEVGGLVKCAESLPAALKDVFLHIDGAVPGEDGSTMSVVLLSPNEGGSVSLVAANVGDSAVVCADFKRMMKTHLTDEHRVTNATEQQRLRDTGSLLTHNGTRLMGLNLSRSIGDKALKEINSGFLAVPYVSKVHTVQAQESLLLLLASDGLWDVTTTTIVVQIAHGVLAEHPGDLSLLCQVLMDHAIKRRSRDDITIVAVHIEAEDPSNQSSAS